MRCYPGRYPESALTLHICNDVNGLTPDGRRVHRPPQPAPGPPRPAFPAFLAGAGRPLLPSMIDYAVFSQLAAARGSIISGPVSRSAMLSISAFRAKFGSGVIWLSAVRVGGLFRVATPLRQIAQATWARTDRR